MRTNSNSIIVRILPIQVPRLWEAVKFACVQADEVKKEDIPSYLNELLHALLNEKAQCFIRLDEDRSLLALMVTRIMGDKITGKKQLLLQCLYSFKTVDYDVWTRDWKLVMDFAKAEKCEYISFESKHPRIWEIGESLGFQETFRRFVFEVGGA